MTLRNPFATTPDKPRHKKLKIVNPDIRQVGVMGMEGVVSGVPIHGAPPSPVDAPAQTGAGA